MGKAKKDFFIFIFVFHLVAILSGDHESRLFTTSTRSPIKISSSAAYRVTALEASANLTGLIGEARAGPPFRRGLIGSRGLG